jgi:osmotically-inducible protein OsmY
MPGGPIDRAALERTGPIGRIAAGRAICPIAIAMRLRQARPTMSRRPFPLPARPLLAALVAAPLLAAAAGCSPVGLAVGAGATAGIAASEERGIEGAARDAAIRVEISELWLDKGFDFYHALEMQIYEGRVVVMGRVPTQAEADTAIRLAWQPDGVREVINEVEVGPSDPAGFATDSATAAKLRAELTFTRGVQAINYSIRVVDGTVFLLGVAQDQAELDRVINTARALPGIRHIVSHVILKDDPRRAENAGGGGAS